MSETLGNLWGGRTSGYFTNVGPTSGPIRYGTVPDNIGVLEGRDHHMPIGTAMCIGHDGAGMALWRIVIDGQELPGRWIVAARQFRPAY